MNGRNLEKDNVMRQILFATTLLLGAAGAAQSAGFSLSSPSIKPGSTLTEAQVFKGFGCEGKNISPALKWSGAPKDTKSFALTVYDPDAPTGSGWWHWVVYDIPAGAKGLVRGAGAAGGALLPDGARMGNTDFGTPEYGGAAPPPGHGPHRYIFTLYALKTEKLDVPAGCTAAYVGFNIHFAKIGEAKLTAKYER